MWLIVLACVLHRGHTYAPPALQAVQQMSVTLSSDHRVVDGAVAAQWLNVFKGSVHACLSTSHDNRSRHFPLYRIASRTSFPEPCAGDLARTKLNQTKHDVTCDLRSHCVMCRYIEEPMTMLLWSLTRITLKLGRNIQHMFWECTLMFIDIHIFHTFYFRNVTR